MNSGVDRIIDANQNRCVEGLRVLESYCRFIREDQALSGEIRSLRHLVRKSLGHQWITCRDSDKDVGKSISKESRLDQKNTMQQILRGNASRVTESLRVLEEYLKLLGRYELSKTMEQARFDVYGIEKKVLMDYQVQGLYGLTGEGTEEDICKQVQMFVDYQVPWIQYRDKKRDEKGICKIAHRIVEIVRGTGSKIIINDYPKIASEVGAQGVHVGQGDCSVEEVRRIAPHLLVGISTHNRQQFDRALAVSPDYIALGPIYETISKQNPEDCEGISLARYARGKTDMPLIAIGGINRENIEEVLSTGINGIAMISGIKSEENLKEMMTMF